MTKKKQNQNGNGSTVNTTVANIDWKGISSVKLLAKSSRKARIAKSWQYVESREYGVTAIAPKGTALEAHLIVKGVHYTVRPKRVVKEGQEVYYTTVTQNTDRESLSEKSLALFDADLKAREKYLNALNLHQCKWDTFVEMVNKAVDEKIDGLARKIKAKEGKKAKETA